MEDLDEILDDSSNPIETDSDYDATSSLDQGYSLDRITFKGLMGFILSILNFEKGILFTVKELLVRPRVVIEEYLKKDRTKLVNPIRFLVFSTALSTFLSLILINNNPEFNSVQINMEDGIDKEMEIAEKEQSKDSLNINTVTKILSHQDSVKLKDKELKREKMKNFGKQVQEITKSNSDKFTFGIVLFFSLFTFLFYRRSNYNLTENLVVNSYMVSITNVFSILFYIPAFFLNNLLLLIIPSLLGIIYTLYFWVNVYNRKSFGGIMRSILVYFVSYISFMAVLGILVAIYVLFLLM